ncbi:MAG: GNAT family N-acetyltransferase [Oscillospiraceae bacterium]|nr:GNAT family N-acetyltransferase [Oscillospiraceae bacterium]
MEIRLIPGYDRPELVRELFEEYTNLIISKDPRFADYLQVQSFDEELAHLEHKYGGPGGRLYLAYWKDKLAGCVAMRQLDEQHCEMKRLYVRLVFRGIGIGDMLVDTLIADAKRHGYKAMLLDTFTFLDRAIEMYRKRGFYEIGQYTANPMDDITIYMKKDL